MLFVPKATQAKGETPTADPARRLSELATARLGLDAEARTGLALDWAAYDAKKKASAPPSLKNPQRGDQIRQAAKANMHVSPDGNKVHVVTDAGSPQAASHEFTKDATGNWSHHTGVPAHAGPVSAITDRLKAGNYTKD